MMSSRTVVMIVFLAWNGLALCQEKKKDSYEDLLSRVKKQDADADFTALRMTYAQTPDYDPYKDYSDTREKIRSAIKDKDFENAMKRLEGIQRNNFVAIWSHSLAAIANKGLENEEQAKFHAYVGNGLLESIKNSGDGKSPETAYVVINTDEQYVFMASLGIRSTQQSLIEKDGHRYDVHDGTDREGQEVVVYFNIDLPMKWLSEALQEKK
jgi:hypothetical protein